MFRNQPFVEYMVSTCQESQRLSHSHKQWPEQGNSGVIVNHLASAVRQFTGQSPHREDED